jgi:hypothetical protein
MVIGFHAPEYCIQEKSFPNGTRPFCSARKITLYRAHIRNDKKSVAKFDLYKLFVYATLVVKRGRVEKKKRRKGLDISTSSGETIQTYTYVYTLL